MLAQEASRRDLAQQEAERLKGLVERKAISQKEADQAASSVQQSAAAVQIARARVRQAELNLSYTNVTAPIGGVTGRALRRLEHAYRHRGRRGVLGGLFFLLPGPAVVAGREHNAHDEDEELHFW